jgi:hypothetical protein
LWPMGDLNGFTHFEWHRVAEGLYFPVDDPARTQFVKFWFVQGEALLWHHLRARGSSRCIAHHVFGLTCLNGFWGQAWPKGPKQFGGKELGPSLPQANTISCHLGAFGGRGAKATPLPGKRIHVGKDKYLDSPGHWMMNNKRSLEDWTWISAASIDVVVTSQCSWIPLHVRLALKPVWFVLAPVLALIPLYSNPPPSPAFELMHDQSKPEDGSYDSDATTASTLIEVDSESEGPWEVWACMWGQHLFGAWAKVKLGVCLGLTVPRPPAGHPRVQGLGWPTGGRGICTTRQISSFNLAHTPSKCTCPCVECEVSVQDLPLLR